MLVESNGVIYKLNSLRQRHNKFNEFYIYSLLTIKWRIRTLQWWLTKCDQKIIKSYSTYDLLGNPKVSIKTW